MRGISVNSRSTEITPANHLLRSWKEISAYMALGIRTVQRYEVRLGLPIHRPLAGNRCAVWAFADEIDAWLKSPGSIRGVQLDSLDERTKPQVKGSPKDSDSTINKPQKLNGASPDPSPTAPPDVRGRARAA